MSKTKKQPERVHCKDCKWWGPEEDNEIGSLNPDVPATEDVCHLNRYAINTKADYWCGEGKAR